MSGAPSTRRLGLVLVGAVLFGRPRIAGAVDGGPPTTDAGEPAGDAGDVAAEAKQRLAEGNRLFREARFDQALEQYRAAYALVPSGKLHFNIGLTEKMRGNAVDAARELDLFLEAPGDAETGFRTDASAYLGELSGIVSTVWARSLAAGSSISVDGVTVPHDEPGRPIRLAPGRHLVLVRGPGGAVAWTRALDLAPGASIAIAPELPSAPAPRPEAVVAADPIPAGPADDQPPPLYRRWWVWALGAAVVGAGVAALLVLRPEGCGPDNDCHVLPRNP